MSDGEREGGREKEKRGEGRGGGAKKVIQLLLKLFRYYSGSAGSRTEGRVF